MTQPDTVHTQLRDEIDRRLAVAKAADDYCRSPWVLGTDQVIDDSDDTVVVAYLDVAAHIALHDPADAIRRYEGELEVLERHAWTNADPRYGITCKGCPNSAAAWPCPEVRSLAHRLGVSVDG